MTDNKQIKIAYDRNNATDYTGLIGPRGGDIVRQTRKGVESYDELLYTKQNDLTVVEPSFISFVPDLDEIVEDDTPQPSFAQRHPTLMKAATYAATGLAFVAPFVAGSAYAQDGNGGDAGSAGDQPANGGAGSTPSPNSLWKGYGSLDATFDTRTGEIGSFADLYTPFHKGNQGFALDLNAALTDFNEDSGELPFGRALIGYQLLPRKDEEMFLFPFLGVEYFSEDLNPKRFDGMSVIGGLRMLGKEGDWYATIGGGAGSIGTRLFLDGAGRVELDDDWKLLLSGFLDTTFQKDLADELRNFSDGGFRIGAQYKANDTISLDAFLQASLFKELQEETKLGGGVGGGITFTPTDGFHISLSGLYDSTNSNGRHGGFEGTLRIGLDLAGLVNGEPHLHTRRRFPRLAVKPAGSPPVGGGSGGGGAK